MNIYIHVKNYISPEHIPQFDDWFSRLRNLVQPHDGFVDLINEKTFDANDNVTVYMKLIFASDEQLDVFRNNPMHDIMLEELDNYRSRDYWDVCVTDDAAVGRVSADYDRIVVNIGDE